MLGYEIEFGKIQAVNLCSGHAYSEKSAGYLACSLLLKETDDLLRLTVNVIRNDLCLVSNIGKSAPDMMTSGAPPGAPTGGGSSTSSSLGGMFSSAVSSAAQLGSNAVSSTGGFMTGGSSSSTGGFQHPSGMAGASGSATSSIGANLVNAEAIVALALNMVGNIGGAEYAENLFADICKLVSPTTSPYIKRKALICLLRLYAADPNSIERTDLWRKRFSEVRGEKKTPMIMLADSWWWCR